MLRMPKTSSAHAKHSDIQSTLLALCSVAILISCCSSSLAQNNDDPIFHVGTTEVVVPISVVSVRPAALGNHDYNQNLEYHHEVRGLTIGDFRVFEDGIEQPIESLTFAPKREWDVKDNFAHHCEYATSVAGGIWGGSDLWPGNGTDINCVSANSRFFFYVVSYKRSPSPAGICHKIQVKVDRPNLLVRARSEYCDFSSPANPLNGTKRGEELERIAKLEKNGKLHIASQVGFLFGSGGSSHIDVAVDLPVKSLYLDVEGKTFVAAIDMLGLVYRRGGEVVLRFSDHGCCFDGYWALTLGYIPFEQNGVSTAAQQRGLTPNRYERQVELPPGDYKVKIVLTDGERFGQVDAPLKIPNNDSRRLAISSVMLCKRFHKPNGTSLEAEHRPLDYIPLVSKGVEFTPAGSTIFTRDDPLIAYFELYDPSRPNPQPLRFNLKVIETKTNKTVIDIGLRDASPWSQPGKAVTAITEQIAVNRLPHGSYQIIVQGFDQAGNSTAPSAANFTVQ